MSRCSDGDQLVVLLDGFTARLAPYVLVIRLESEGFRLTLDQDNHLFVEPGERLRRDDADALRQYKDDVIRLLRYTPDDSHLYTHRPTPEAQNVSAA